MVMRDSKGPFSQNPWRSLDRVAFCENAILLEVKDPSQGKAHKTPANHSELTTATAARSWRDEQSLRNFLDDVALVAAGPGGKDKVAAVCLEREWQTAEKSGLSLCLRVARNEGFDEQACSQLQHLLDQALQDSVRGGGAGVAGSHATVDGDGDGDGQLAVPPDQRPGPLLESIVCACRTRLEKHASRLLGQLKHAQCRAVGKCSPPAYCALSQVTERAEIVDLFGPYGAHTHARYMAHVARQLDELRHLCDETDKDAATVSPATWCRVSTVAYQCRGSGTLRLYLKENLGLKAKVGVLDTMVDEIVERIGKLARFCRAGHTIAMFAAWLAHEDIGLTVRGLAASKIEVQELKHRTVADVLARGGSQMQKRQRPPPDPATETQIRGKMQRWPRYRMHAEVQLAVFYEEQAELETVTAYVGGDKLCCYLCHEFLRRHGRLQGNGCHQSLYSLWMVPESITFVSSERADQFHEALRGLCDLLESRMLALRGRSGGRGPERKLKRLYASQNESIANISRISLPPFPFPSSLSGRASTPSQLQSPLPLPRLDDNDTEVVLVSRTCVAVYEDEDEDEDGGDADELEECSQPTTTNQNPRILSNPPPVPAPPSLAMSSLAVVDAQVSGLLTSQRVFRYLGRLCLINSLSTN
ncbi:hypothetical protein A1O3_00324 [Capronia epimyces CBS 606.96]|uniref:Uncharacterized protein n=1 Tax=Capronia epimyces CBS 606.96 TaxID=1182542 RepID=W9ZB60_9EURO|nr:uncharacterized protein A1O3_00324 [Capronia epimyces CBS 606.96]EXJ91774.1 hypothetical protein A1O3_00324 [Capronia epimyces CBS 606.96]